MANNWREWRVPFPAAVLAIALTIAGSATGQEPFAVPRTSTPPTFDGDLAEWGGSPSLPLDPPQQRLPGPVGAPASVPWSGERDLSGTFWFRYDGLHLYLAGQIRDDSLVAGTAAANYVDGDAIELRLQFTPEASGPGAETAAPNWSLWVLPGNETRPWIVVGDAADPARSEAFGAHGIRVASRPMPPEAYAFEVAIPLHEIAGLKPGERRIGATLIVHDRDVGRATTNSYSAFGVDTDRPRVGDLLCDGAPLLVADDTGVALLQQFADHLPYVVLPLLVMALLLVATRAWRTMRKRLPRLRGLGRASGILLFVLGVALPGVLIGMRGLDREAKLDAVVQTLRDALPEMEGGALASYSGTLRDRALVRLLNGESIERKQSYDHRFLMDLVEPGDIGFGSGRKFYPVEDFPVLPYWIPLPLEHVETFAFGAPWTGSTLSLVLSAPATATGSREGEPLPRLRVVFLRAGEAKPIHTQEVVFRRPFESASPFNQPGRDMTFERIEWRGDADALALTALQGEGLQLVGMTVRRPRDAQARPLQLGLPSRAGVRTDLRAGYPEDAGIDLAPGVGSTAAANQRRVRLADSTTSFQKLWLFYRARSAANPAADLPTGAPVAEVTIRFRGEVPPRIVRLHHQTSVLYEVARANTRDEPTDPATSIAFQWDGEGGERRVNLVHEIDLPDGAVVESLHFENLGPYRIRFRSVVFGQVEREPPFESAGSPLEPVDGGRRVAAKPEFVEKLAGARFALYRSGRLSAATLRDDERRDRSVLPRRVQKALAGAAEHRQETAVDESRVSEAWQTLPGDGWAGAVLGVLVRDDAAAAHARSVHLLGLGLVLLAAPLLLLVAAELLTVLHNLRLRLLTVLLLATLLPLAVLSVVLVRVIEAGHESDSRDELLQDLGNASRRMRDDLDAFRVATEGLLGALVDADRGSGLEAVALPARRARIESVLQGRRDARYGGYLLLEVAEPTATDPAASFTVFQGDATLLAPQTPMRDRAAFEVVWGKSVVGMRIERESSPGRRLTLTAVERIDTDTLAALAPNRAVTLCDLRGYPLAQSGGDAADEVPAGTLQTHPELLRQRAAALAEVVDGGQPAFVRHDVAPFRWVAAYDVLRDEQDAPRWLLGVVAAERPASLPLAVGTVPVRGFFLAGGGMLVLFSVFLSMVVARRISRPIEQLERGARALSAGDLEVRLESDEGGQIGELTHTFNRMAHDLRSRIQDLNELNRGIRELTARLDLNDALVASRQFFVRNTPADAVQFLLRDRERDRVDLVAGAAGIVVDRSANDVQAILRATGPFSLRLAAGGGAAAGSNRRALPEVLPYRSCVGLPMLVGGRSTGVILLLFEDWTPEAVDLEFLATMAAQTAAAVENARLYRHAVEDPVTGAFVPEHFHTLVEREISQAETAAQPACLLELTLVDGVRWLEQLGREPVDRVFERAAAVVRAEIPADGLLCRAEESVFQILLRSTDRRSADALGERLLAALAAADLGWSGETPPSWNAVAVAFPDDAASAEFMFHALASRRAGPTAVSLPSRQRLRQLRDAGIVLNTPAMQNLVRTLERFAQTGLTVLLQGETGTGKEVLTDLIHRWSKRSKGPLVKVHCAALSESLLQSELFGHEKGSFTGAVARKIGRFEAAQGGTIFLDEIGEISLDVQVKLLRVLQERVVERVGGTQPVPVDVRVIAATHRDIAAMVAAGTFREDLFYRLQGVVVRVPPLRERKQEIPALVEHFRREALDAGHTQVTSFAADAMDELFRHEWPGNIRELRNVVFRAMVMASGEVVRRGDILGLTWNAPPGDDVDTRSTAPRPTNEPPPRPAVEPASRSAIDPAPTNGEPIGMPEPATSEAATRHGAEGVSATNSGGPKSEPAGDAAPRTADRPITDGTELPEPIEAAGPTPLPEATRLSARQQLLVRLLRDRSPLSTDEYVRIAGVSPRTGLRDLADLVATGLAVRVGSRRGARYLPSELAMQWLANSDAPPRS